MKYTLKTELMNTCVLLNLWHMSKDKIIASILDAKLDIVKDSTSDIIECIDSHDNIEDIIWFVL